MSSMEMEGALPAAAPVVVGAALAAAAAYVAANDPTAAGSRFPVCLFHQATGLWCPGCGLTRGVHAMLHGDVVAAVASNMFTPVVVVAIVSAWMGWMRRSWGRPPRRRISSFAPTWASPALIAVAVVYGVARNIPSGPFRSLAP